jgi:AraC-like DNA-binding protein
MNALTELRSLIARHGAEGRGQSIVSGLNVAAIAGPTRAVHGLYEPVFAIVAQGTKRMVLADRTFDCGAGDFIVVPVDVPVTSYVLEASEVRPYLAFAMAVKPQLVASLLLDAPPSVGSDQSVEIGVSRTTPELLDAAVRLLRLLDRPSDVAIMRPMIEREIVWRLLNGERGEMVRQIGLADSRLAKIGHATRWIREHYADPLRIEELAERVAMSPTSFFRHFRAATAMSPLQYQKRIRLQEARSLLMTRTGDVANVGYSVGYESPSQFSREYARLFGAPPSRDVESLRDSYGATMINGAV